MRSLPHPPRPSTSLDGEDLGRSRSRRTNQGPLCGLLMLLPLSRHEPVQVRFPTDQVPPPLTPASSVGGSGSRRPSAAQFTSSTHCLPRYDAPFCLELRSRMGHSQPVFAYSAHPILLATNLRLPRIGAFGGTGGVSDLPNRFAEGPVFSGPASSTRGKRSLIKPLRR